MISLKQLLQEQDEVNYELTDEFVNKVKAAADAETNPLAKAVASEFYDLLFPASVSWGMIAAGFVTYAFRKQLIGLAGKMWKSGYNPVKLVGKQLAIQAPMKAFLRLDKDGAAIWTQKAILAPLKRIQSANSSNSDIYKQARHLERQILSNMDPADFVKLATATRKMFQSKTYEALLKLRQTGGRGIIDEKLQIQFEKLFVELNRINSSIFSEDYIQVVLKSLKIEPKQINDILTTVFPAYSKRAERASAYSNRAPIRPTMLTKANLQATPSSGTISKTPRGTVAQHNYMMSLPYADRPTFRNIVNNLSDERQKRAGYVDDLMRLPHRPDVYSGSLTSRGSSGGFHIDDWRKLNIPGKESLSMSEAYQRYLEDLLFYNANKLSGPAIK